MLQKKLGISNDKAMEMECALKGAGTGDEEIFTTAEKLELEKAREQFYGCEGNLADILKTVEGIYRTHPTNERALSLYLPCLAASGKENEVFKINNELGADVLSCYITAIDICLTKEDMTEAEKWLRKAAVVFAESNVLKCYQTYYYLKMYKKYGDFRFLEKATNANASLKDVNGPLELSHQLRVMSLLQVESGEEPPVYDKDFCKENGLYFRVVANVSLGGVYVEGMAGAAAAAASASADVVPKDYFVEDLRGNKRQIWFFVKKDEKPDANGKYYNFGALVSEPDVEDYIFIVRHEDFLDPEQYYNEDETDLSREEQEEISIKEIFEFCFEGKQIDASQIDFTPEDSDGTEDDLKLYLQASINTQYNDTYELFFFNTRCSIFGDYTDEYGNDCSTDTSSICVSNSGVNYYNVKELINSGAAGDDYVFDDYIRKIPVIFFSYYRYTEYGEQWQDIDFDDYLRDDYDHYILDSNGNKVKSLKDLESFEHDGVIYYRVAESDFKDSNTGNPLTPEAVARWKAKLGL